MALEANRLRNWFEELVKNMDSKGGRALESYFSSETPAGDHANNVYNIQSNDSDQADPSDEQQAA
jgi:hypothetical protein